jgi:2-polyprenyl-3-methyl-5-hydroxy-6-metoxy-1,4-benzoquinol methylase
MGDDTESRRDELVQRILRSTGGAFDIFTLYIGDRLGFYADLAAHGPSAPGEVAARTGTHERYVREWLEQQAVTGMLHVEDESAPAQSRRYALPPGSAEVLTDRESLNYLAPLPRLVAGAVRPLHRLLRAYRTGEGVPYALYGPDLVEGQAGMNRAMFLRQLGTEWLPAIPDVHRRLQENPPGRVADLGCGAGWSCIGIARAYPRVHVDGFDLDEPSVALARANVAEAGLDGRVSIQHRDAGDSALAGRYDLVTAFECVHDMADPVAALRTMLHLAGKEGSVLVMDERVGEQFTARGNEVEWMMYGWSVLHCLPVGKAGSPSAETGTVMRPDTLRRYAAEAGFCDLEILPIDNYFFRFYRLRTICG